MAEYIFKFNEQCCPAGKINKIISWNYQPGDGGGNINFVENTVFYEGVFHNLAFRVGVRSI